MFGDIANIAIIATSFFSVRKVRIVKISHFSHIYQCEFLHGHFNESVIQSVRPMCRTRTLEIHYIFVTYSLIIAEGEADGSESFVAISAVAFVIFLQNPLQNHKIHPIFAKKFANICKYGIIFVSL